MSAVMTDDWRETDSEEMKSAHIALESWARWARTGLSGLGFPSISLIGKIIRLGIRGASQTTGAQIVEIDQLCEYVDRAILRLDDTEREVVYRTYLFNDAAQVTARKCGLTYGYYRHVLARVRRRVGDFLAGAEKKLL